MTGGEFAREVVGEGDVYSFPLSFAQERLWFLERLQPGSSAYNIPLRMRLSGALDRDALEHAVNGLVARHEALRTCIVDKDGNPYQLVHEQLRVPLEVINLADSPAESREKTVERLVLEEALEPFDLTRAPLLRAILLRLAGDEHVFLLTIHHIVADAWSTGILFRDLAELYAAGKDVRFGALPELHLQYGDYAMWQREWLVGERLTSEIAYWRELLEGAPPVLELPTDRPRPPVQSDRGGHLTRVLAPSLLERIHELSSAAGATLFMTLLAAFNVLLARYTGQDDILVGSPVANRTRPELENIVGFFVNTLVLRTDTSGNPTFRELLARVRDLTLDALAHQDVPFEKVVEELNPDRALSHSPLFQVMFALQNTAKSTSSLPGLTLSRIELERGTSKFDLGLFAEEANGLVLSCEYSTDLFDAGRVERLLGHLEMILVQIVENPDARLGELELLTPSERRQIESWNATNVALPISSRRIHELVEARTRQAPDDVAVSYGSETLTYDQLNRRANQLAHRLKELGVGPDVPVGICLERSMDMPVAVLATLKARGAYVPLDPSYPSGRLALMLEDAAAPVVIAHEATKSVVPAEQVQVVDLGAERSALAARPEANPGSEGTADHLAYILFTSGSTGRPKGVAMPHAVLTNLVDWQLTAWEAPAGARTLQFASLSFDVAFQELFSTWTAGGVVVLVDEQTRRDAASLLAFMDDENIERIFVPFVALQQLAEAAAYVGRVPRRLREVMTAGEALQITPSIRSFFESTGARLYNQYGPTESHVVTQHTLTGPPESWEQLPPIGRPITNARISILDRFGQFAPVGVPGDLYIGGEVLARGYVNQPELTAERFVADRFAIAEAARLYRTGDVACYGPDGNIHYLGRADTQIKLRGYRVELAEIEAALARHASVSEAVAAVADLPGGDSRLVAYVVSDSPAGLDAVELRRFLAASLPKFMIPSAFVVMDALPLTPSGKIDRRALPEPRSEVHSLAGVVRPRDDVEMTLVEIWTSVLDVDGSIGIRDDFFALGGHSLLAVRLFAEIEKALKVKLPLSLLFQEATIEHLAREVRARRKDPRRWPSLIPLQPEGDRPPLFLMHGIDGELLFYRDFLKALPRDQPIYALQPRALDRRSYPHMRLEDMASEYVTAITEFLPTGPYLLCGYCFAGVLAYEVGHQLHHRGSPPALLALIDASPWGHIRTRRVEIERQKFREFLDGGFRERRAWIARRSRGLRWKVVTNGRWITVDTLLRLKLPVPGFLWTMEAVGRRAMASYVTPTSPARVTLFRAASDGGSFYHRSFWTRIAEGGVDIRPIHVEGIRHDNILREPYVDALVAELTDCLEVAPIS